MTIQYCKHQSKYEITTSQNNTPQRNTTNTPTCMTLQPLHAQLTQSKIHKTQQETSKTIFTNTHTTSPCGRSNEMEMENNNVRNRTSHSLTQIEPLLQESHVTHMFRLNHMISEHTQTHGISSLVTTTDQLQNPENTAKKHQKPSSHNHPSNITMRKKLMKHM